MVFFDRSEDRLYLLECRLDPDDATAFELRQGPAAALRHTS